MPTSPPPPTATSPPPKFTVHTAKQRELSMCARRRGCSPSSTVRMCSFWMSSMVPTVRPPPAAIARQSGNGPQLKGHMWLTAPLRLTLL